MAAPLTPTNVLMTVASNGYLWAYTTDNQILTGMDPTGTIVYQQNIPLSTVGTFTQFAVNAATNEIYCTTGPTGSNKVLVAYIETPPTPLTFLPYIDPSPEPTDTLSYLILSKDNTVLFQYYDSGNIYGCIGGNNSLPLSFSGVTNIYAEQDPIYPNGITVVTQPSSYATTTVIYTSGTPVNLGGAVAVNSSFLPRNQLIAAPLTTLPPVM